MYSKIFVEKLHSFRGHTDCVYALELCSDSRFFISAGGDGLVVKWDLQNQDSGVLIAKLPNSIYALHFLPNDNLLIAGQNYEGIHLLDWQNKRELKSLKLTQAAIFDFKSINNKLFVASGDGQVTVVDLQTWTILARMNSSSKSARTLAINPHKNELAVGYSDYAIRVFDLDSFKLKHQWQAHKNSIFTLAYSHDFHILLSGSRDARIKSWDVETQYTLKQEVAAHLYAINHIAFCPAGNLVATGSMDKSVKIWDGHDLQLLKVVDKARHAGHGTSVNKVLWLDSHQLLSAGDDRLISQWKLAATVK
jgi:WD40 repeat protein